MANSNYGNDGSRIAPDHASTLTFSAACDVDVIDWVKTNQLIISITLSSSAHTPGAITSTLQFRNVTDGGSFANVVSGSGELRRGISAGVLSNTTSPVGTSSACETNNLDDSEEVENESPMVSGSLEATQNDSIEIQYCVDMSNALDGKQYEFRIDPSDGNPLAAAAAQVTTEIVETEADFSIESRYVIELQDPFSIESKYIIELQDPFSIETRYLVELQDPFSVEVRYSAMSNADFSIENRYLIELQDPFSIEARYAVLIELEADFSVENRYEIWTDDNKSIPPSHVGTSRLVFKNPRSTSQNDVYIFFVEGYKLKYQWSGDDGATWSSKLVVYGVGGAYVRSADVKIYDTGSLLDVYIALIDPDTNTSLIYIKGTIADGSDTISFSSAQTVDGALTISNAIYMGCSIARTDNGRLVIAWEEDVTAGTHLDKNIIGSDGAGASPTWSGETLVHTATNFAFATGVGLESFSSAYPNRVIMYFNLDNASSQYQYRAVTYDWDGATMTEVDSMDSVSRSGNRGDISCVVYKDRVHMTVSHAPSSSNRIFYIYSPVGAGGGAWITQTFVTSLNTDAGGEFSLSVNRANDMLYAFYHGTGVESNIRYKMFKPLSNPLSASELSLSYSSSTSGVSTSGYEQGGAIHLVTTPSLDVGDHGLEYFALFGDQFSIETKYIIELQDPFSVENRYIVELQDPFSIEARYNVEVQTDYSVESRYETEVRDNFSIETRYETEIRDNFSIEARYEIDTAESEADFSIESRYEVEIQTDFSVEVRYSVEIPADFSIESRYLIELQDPFSIEVRYETEIRDNFSIETKYEAEIRDNFSKQARYEVEVQTDFSIEVRYEVEIPADFSIETRYETEIRDNFSIEARYLIAIGVLEADFSIEARYSVEIPDDFSIESRYLIELQNPFSVETRYVVEIRDNFSISTTYTTEIRMDFSIESRYVVEVRDNFSVEARYETELRNNFSIETRYETEVQTDFSQSARYGIKILDAPVLEFGFTANQVLSFEFVGNIELVFNLTANEVINIEFVGAVE